MMVSPVFRTMFNGKYKESSDAEVHLPGKKLVEVQWMLDYLYPEVTFQLTGKHKFVLIFCHF